MRVTGNDGPAAIDNCDHRILRHRNMCNAFRQERQLQRCEKNASELCVFIKYGITEVDRGLSGESSDLKVSDRKTFGLDDSLKIGAVGERSSDICGRRAAKHGSIKFNQSKREIVRRKFR